MMGGRAAVLESADRADSNSAIREDVWVRVPPAVPLGSTPPCVSPGRFPCLGDRPYGAGEIASVLETPVAGVIAWDPGGVAALWAEGVTRRWAKSWLARSARATHDSLLEVVAPVEVRR